MHYDDAFRHIGEFGRYQKFLYLLICLPQMFSGIQTFLPVFILHVPDHRCTTSQNGPMAHTVNMPDLFPVDNYTTVMDTERNIRTRYLKCEIIQYKIESNDTNVYTTNSTKSERSKCHHWVYDKKDFDVTFAMQSNLVCDRKADRTHAVMAFMAGLTGGSLATGFISDLYGRKKAFMLCIILLIIPNICLTFVTDYMIFVFLRCISGFSVGGLLGTGFVMGMEIVGPTKRSWAGLVFEFFWAAGAMLLALTAYFIRDWRHLNLTMSVPPVLFLIYFWLIPESPRWLLIKGRTAEAEAILRKTAIINKRNLPYGLFEKYSVESKHRRLPLWKACTHPKLMYQLTVILYGWMVVSMVFYGLAMNSGNIGGSLYLNFFMSSFAEFLGFALCLGALHKTGRRSVFAVSILISGVACIITIFPVLYANADFQWTSMVLSTIGKICVSAAFAVMFLYSGEIFPTVIRNSALGISAFFARIGGMVAPYIIDLAAYIDSDVGKATPLIVFGVTALVAGIIALKLPETKDMSLPETIEDWMNYGNKGLADIEINISCDKLNGGSKTELKEIHRSRTFEQGSENEIQQLT